MPIFIFKCLLNLRGVPSCWLDSYGAILFNVSISLLFWIWTFGSNIKQLILFYCNYLSIYDAVLALEIKSLAPIPAVPILEIYASACCELGVLIKKLSDDLKFNADKPLINAYPW